MWQNTVTLAKPDGAQWFNQIDPTAQNSYHAWMRSQPGFVSHTPTFTDANTINITQVWQSQADFDAAVLARQAHTDYQAKKTYEAQAGITTTLISSGPV